ncbi:MAG: RluA family pseudouridine synthase [Anaerorhabdus sp.]
MIKVIFEDNHLLVVEKPVNIPVQLDQTQDEDLLSILKNYIKEKYKKPGNVYLGLIHRLDRPVGGVMVFAKTSKAASRLSDQLRRKVIKKEYHAIVESSNLKTKDTLIDNLIKDEKTNMVRVSNSPKAKKAILHYNVVSIKNNLSLVKIELETGRSHQIRVQFASRNAPLLNDQRYNKNATVNNQIALWATCLTLEHPTSKETMTFYSDLPMKKPWNIFKEEKL